MSWANQITNRNFLSPVGFKFNLTEKPKIDFFCDSVTIPGINLGSAIQSTYLKNLPVPGDVLSYDDLEITFNVDENMENYLELHDWLVQFGFPDNFGQYQQLLDEDSGGVQTATSGMSDGNVIIYNSKYNPIIDVRFRDLFPVSISPIKFESKVDDIQYVMASAVFKYTIFDFAIIGN
jgi:hypothetical protein